MLTHSSIPVAKPLTHLLWDWKGSRRHWRYFLFAQITSWRSLVIWPTKRSFHQTYKYDEKTNKLHQVGPKESTTGFLLGAVHHWPPRRPKKSTSEFLVTQKQHPPVCLQSRTKPGNIVWSPPSIPLMTFEGGSTLRKRFDRRFDGLKSLWRFQVKRAPFSSGKGDSYWKPPFLGAMLVLGRVYFQNCSNKPWSWRVPVGYPKHDQICCYLDNGTPGYLYIYLT